MKRPVLTTTLIAAAVVLAGCSAGVEPNQPARSATTSAAETSAPTTTTAPGDADATPATSAPETTASTVEPQGDSDASEARAQAWADEAYTTWFDAMRETYIHDTKICRPFDDLEGYRRCVLRDPHAYITEFTADALGHLIVHVTPDERWLFDEYDTVELPGLEFVAENVGVKLMQAQAPALTVTARLTDGSDEYTGSFEDEDWIVDYFEKLDK